MCIDKDSELASAMFNYLTKILKHLNLYILREKITRKVSLKPVSRKYQ